MAVTVRDCEVNQAEWNFALAVAGGGSVWEDRGLRWSWQAHDRQLMLSFPRSIDAAAVRRGIEFASERNACIVGAWLSSQTDPAQLEAAGFERGWEPWWMAAPLGVIAKPQDTRAVLSVDVPEYGPEGRRLLSMTRRAWPRAFHAVVRVDERFAGRAWCMVHGDVAGVYDMDVWPQFQRRGLGRALLRVLCSAARAAGATSVVLNATPAGEPLYSAEGLARIGEGVTYWHHLGTTG